MFSRSLLSNVVLSVGAFSLFCFVSKLAFFLFRSCLGHPRFEVVETRRAFPLAPLFLR